MTALKSASGARDTGIPAGTLFVLLGPVLALFALTAAAAMAAVLADWHRDAMALVAAGAGTTTLALALLVVYRQVYERRVARQALEYVEARVSGIVDSAMDPIVAVDEDQRIVLFNAAAEKVFRWPRAAALGQPLDLLIPERLREKHRAHIRRFAETGVTSRRMGDQTLLVGVRANGEEFPIDASISQLTEGGKRLFTVILRDVTERARAEAMLARSEARLRGILDSAMDAIITVDESQHIVLFNAAAEAVFGCPREQAIGAPLAWFIPARFRDAHTQHIRAFGANGASPRRMGVQRIVTGLRRSGEEFPIDASISQVTEHGSVFYTVILRDVTERVRAEEALRDSREELRELGVAAHSVREQEKTRIARELHDELGQALTAFKMDVSWIKERLPASETAIADKLARMHVLLDTTVAATRRISADLRPLILDDLGLIAGIEWLVQDFTRRTGIEGELAIAVPELELQDPQATALFRILQESLTNVARHARASQVEVVLDRSGDSVMLSVRDNGEGFVTTRPRQPNSYGLLGLRERAHLLGGEARIDSAPGQGTTIEVRIPIAEERPQA
jgi:PAS domain S-box-containing protein